MDQTLPDDAWKDSFDRLLDPLPYVGQYFNYKCVPLINKPYILFSNLRELNLIKKNVRKSFNMDSSVENSNPNILSVDDCSFPNARNNLTNAGDKLSVINKFGNSISTPFAKRFPDNLFDCALSPIGGMKLDGYLPKDNPKPGIISKIIKANIIIMYLNSFT